MAVHGGNLGGAPARPVDDPGVLRPGRIRGGQLVQLGPTGRRLLPELVVEPGQFDSAGLIAWGEPEPKVELQRPAQLLPQEPAQGSPVHPAQHLSHQVPVKESGLAVGGARLPQRLLAGQQPAEAIPVVEGVGRHGFFDGHHPGLVGEEMADRGRSPELRPVPLDRRVEVDAASVDQPQGAGRGQRLAHRIGLHDAVSLPLRAAAGVGGPAPDINHDPALAGDAERRPGAGLVAHRRQKPVLHRPEIGVRDASDLDHGARR